MCKIVINTKTRKRIVEFVRWTAESWVNVSRSDVHIHRVVECTIPHLNYRSCVYTRCCCCCCGCSVLDPSKFNFSVPCIVNSLFSSFESCRLFVCLGKTISYCCSVLEIMWNSEKYLVLLEFSKYFRWKNIPFRIPHKNIIHYFMFKNSNDSKNTLKSSISRIPI